MRRITWNKAYRTEGEAHLEVAHSIALGDLTEARKPKVQPYEDRQGKTKYKITVLPKSATN